MRVRKDCSFGQPSFTPESSVTSARRMDKADRALGPDSSSDFAPRPDFTATFRALAALPMSTEDPWFDIGSHATCMFPPRPHARPDHIRSRNYWSVADGAVGRDLGLVKEAARLRHGSVGMGVRVCGVPGGTTLPHHNGGKDGRCSPSSTPSVQLRTSSKVSSGAPDRLPDSSRKMTL